MSYLYDYLVISNFVVLCSQSYLDTWRLEQSSPTCNWRRSRTSVVLWTSVPAVPSKNTTSS